MPTPRSIERTYLVLVLGSTLSASLIWGVNTLFLLDAGLSNLEAFGANAFFTLGMVLFEVPTGVVADTRGRRTSYLLGTLTLAGSTALYLVLWVVQGPFWAWATVSVLLGLGFTFFSGAVEAWLVDALHATGWEGRLETVLGHGQVVAGLAMLTGAVGGGLLAQATDLGAPFVVRVVLLTATFVVAALAMHDVGFTPERGTSPTAAVRTVLHSSLRHGLGNPPVRWVMLAAPVLGGVDLYVFYAMQPYLLELVGDPRAYAVAGLAAAVVAGSQVVGGAVAPYVARALRRRTTVLLVATGAGVVLLALIGRTDRFGVALTLLVVSGVVRATAVPVRQAYLNDLVPSRDRATVLSFDSLMSSSGGVVLQPALGRVADLHGYGASFVVGAAVQTVALPVLWAARRARASQDVTRATAG